MSLMILGSLYWLAVGNIPFGAASSAVIGVYIDPDSCLTKEMSDKFKALNTYFNDVFDSQPFLYIAAGGKSQAFVNMGHTLPPETPSVQQKYSK